MRVWRARRPFRCVGGMCSALCLRTSACDRAHGSKNFTRNLAIPNNLRITVSALCIASLLLRRLRLPHGTFFDYFWSSWKRKKVDEHAGLGKRRVHVLLSSIQSPSRTIVGSRTLPRACCFYSALTRWNVCSCQAHLAHQLSSGAATSRQNDC